MQDLIIRVDSLVYGGDGMGRLPDGRAVFVPFVLPVELARVIITEEKKSHARAELVEILEPSKTRVKPRCPHFSICGGCHYQHMDYLQQLALKAGIVEEQIRRIGGIERPPVKAIVSSPLPWNYRNTVQFHLDSMGKPGYQKAGSHEVIPIRECHLPALEINEIWPSMDFDADTGLERITIRQGVESDVLIELAGIDEAAPEVNLEMPASMVYQGSGDAVVLAGESFIEMEVKGRRFQVSSGSFFQVNTAMADKMVDHVLSIADLRSTSTVLDVYCGVGLFSAFLAPRTERCIGIEISPSACSDFIVNLDDFDNVELYEGPAEVVLPDLKVKPDVILVDPPRTGLDRSALDAILSLKPATMIYVSCDPSTLGRDVKRLVKGGYELLQITPFDLFPQTYHIESISLFRYQG